jgi:hypothetical protein
MYLGYGRPYRVTEVNYADGKVYITDFIITSGARTSPGEPYNRVHVLDAGSGRRERRFPVGFGATFLTAAGDSVGVVHPGGVSYFSNRSGKKLFTWNKKTLPHMYPQLASGIDRFMWGDGRNIMELFAMDGSKWNLYTRSGKLFEANEEQPAGNYPAWFINEYDVRSGNDPHGHAILQLGYKNDNQQQRYLCDAQNNQLNAEMFLEGHPVALYSKDSTLVVLHYETTKKERFIFTCISKDGKKIYWKLKQTDLNASYRFDGRAEVPVAYDEDGGRLFFCISKEIFAVALHDGKLLWRQKL